MNMYPQLVSPDNLAILQNAVDRMLSVLATRNVNTTVNELASLLSSAFEAGERDPAKLAEAALARHAAPLR